MSATIIDGKAVAADIVDRVAGAAARFRAAQGRAPGLAVALVGENPASQVYVRNKGKKAEACGFLSIQETLPATTAEETLLALIADWNADDRIDGILVQMPLPDAIDADAVIRALTPEKDVDGFNVINIGKLCQEDPSAFVACTPAGVVELLKRSGVATSGQRV
ncbi:MAG: tetrahydrofolate dehydrogenase/cyclohydrolase catalytic domain-containing protein, partial [Pseudomonadota bacterium]